LEGQDFYRKQPAPNTGGKPCQRQVNLRLKSVKNGLWVIATESMLIGQGISGKSIIKLPKSVYPVQCFWISIALGLKAEIGKNRRGL